jgi:predicted Rossmann fold flavoprotein
MKADFWDLAIIGGGAAGFFAAANLRPGVRSVILEGSARPLSKVAISGGGRCNVTHACFDPAELIRSYPRGGKELRGPFSRFQPRDTMEWFESRGVPLKIEEDGRVFPVSDSSQSIIDCLMSDCSEIRLKSRVEAVNKQDGRFVLELKDGQRLEAENLLLCTGSGSKGHWLAQSLGHSLTDLAPSLFTFRIEDKLISGLPGISFQDCSLSLQVGQKRFKTRGAVLITHWGLSGPAVLRLSSLAARELYATGYSATLTVDWLSSSIEERLIACRREKKLLRKLSPGLPGRFWERLLEIAGIDQDLPASQLSNNQIRAVEALLRCSHLQVEGKGEFKDEFVTCGGVSLSEVNLKTMESKLVPGLYFAGEVLDIDGITGGFNFQAAWSTAWHVAQGI